MENYLTEKFYRFPQHATTTMTRKQVKETLLTTGGAILANGYMWNIKSNRIGVGVYQISLEMQK